ncbi:HNH endonuclease signature motif containing protein [Spelaeicoccus albus]|uniref:HNH nuclease domain-containing protein n=1 Tax=Spelaeicoccus albus TaxID=1280376 RepID=A0A7Z0D1C7_9MICO|nr:HNH endonuclease signature motif containing protein [Spelaeicoccus albus]NYI66788.1 hypothetical protein [Spelaeicoccus albus]
MKKAAGPSESAADDAAPGAPSFDELAQIDESTLDAGELLRAVGDCAKAMAFFQARQTEFLAAFGGQRTDPDKQFPGGKAASASSPAEASEPADDDAGVIADAAAPDGTAAPDASGESSTGRRRAFRASLADLLLRWAGDEVACELDIAGVTGTTRLLDGMLVVSCLPQVLAALKAGRLSARRFRKIVDAARNLPAGLAGELDDAVADWDEGITFDTFGRRTRRWLITKQALLAEENRQRTTRDRSVQFSPDRDGSAWLTLFGPADRLRSLFNRVDTAARAHDGSQEIDWGEPDARTLDQLRFDLLTGVQVRTQGGREVDPARYRITVTVPFATLLGAELPGDMAGYGPIPAPMARQIAAGSDWIERLLTDPATGRPLDADRNRYRLSSRMKDFIRTRDRECTLPSCSKPAGACEIDHLIPWIDGQTGGLSEKANLHPVCKSHHQAKTAKRFTVEVRPRPSAPSSRWHTGPRILRWTLPTGRHYDVMDDHDPTAAGLELDALHRAARRGTIGQIKRQRHRRRRKHC